MNRFSVDLVRLQNLCSHNYQRLHRILARSQGDEIRLAWEQGSISMEVHQLSMHTWQLRLCLNSLDQRWAPRMDLQVHLYHDARMAEVVAVQRLRPIPARNRYPNHLGMAADEKSQINEFLAEALTHCLLQGAHLSATL